MDTPNRSAALTLTSQRLGAIPLVNHFLARMRLGEVLGRWLPCHDARCQIAPATLARIVVTNLVIDHQPMYGLGEWANAHAPAALGVSADQVTVVNDDRAGRMLDRLFHADRVSMLAELMVAVFATFSVDTSRLHNDSTSLTVHGAYPSAAGQPVAGSTTPAITWGHSKDHRPDLKQLVFILTVAADGAVPVIYRLADGNTSDDPTHVPTWDDLVALTGRTDFLYVADCKLASSEAMSHIHRHGGRFVTVLPRSRKEDAAFRGWATTHTPAWVELARRPGARIGEADQVVSTCLAPQPSAEGFPVIWVHDTNKHQRDAYTRQKKTDKGVTAVDELNQRLTRPRCRLKDRPAVHAAAEAALTAAAAERWVTFTLAEHTTEDFKQDHAGRPGPHTTYRKTTKIRWQVTAEVNHERVRHDAATDGCYPLITNDAALSHADVWNAYHWQPHLERRHHILKGVQDATPVWLKDIGRIEALFCCHFIALLTSALIEREIRQAMTDADITKIPLYPELRGCAAPSIERILTIFNDVTRHELHDHDGHLIQVFEPQLTALQQQVLTLLGIPETAYTDQPTSAAS